MFAGDGPIGLCCLVSGCCCFFGGASTSSGAGCISVPSHERHLLALPVSEVPIGVACVAVAASVEFRNWFGDVVCNCYG
jgi:hypothetical protein